MHARKTLSMIATVLMMLALVTSASAQISWTVGPSPAAFLPWTVTIFDDDSGADSLSAAFIGPGQFPVFSYVDSDATVTLAYPKDMTVFECGPENTWTCFPMTPTNALEETFSAIATATDPLDDNLYITAWAFERSQPGMSEDHDINVYVRAFSGNLQDGGGHTEYLINLGDDIWSNYTLKGKPSLAIDSDLGFHVALVVHNNSNGLDGLMYSFPSETDSDSCGYTLKQRCILIDGTHLDGHPVLVLDISDLPRITYYQTDNDRLKFAYPQNQIEYHPNCGPGGNTWRCIIIHEEPDTDTILPQMSMAIGLNHPQIAYTVDIINEVPIDTRRTYHAKFVGSDGNCGLDYAITDLIHISEIFRWQCSIIASTEEGNTIPYHTLSLQVDPLDYPVIAKTTILNDDNWLSVCYPPERLGLSPETSWYGYAIDPSGSKYASLALSEDGMGLIVYKDDDTLHPNLNLAFQPYLTYLPSIMH